MEKFYTLVGAVEGGKVVTERNTQVKPILGWK